MTLKQTYEKTINIPEAARLNNSEVKNKIPNFRENIILIKNDPLGCQWYSVEAKKRVKISFKNLF